ncbi:MAG: class I SAM-dependent methyltransferase [Phycisphaerales bacterium]|nr:class I SAM-dependent methyltransferase [Phycisphaerales bacterium]
MTAVQPAAVPAPSPDFAKIKATQQATWASGDFSRVASRVVFVAEQLIESADVQAGDRVLDVATGSGNAAIAAARRNASALGVDYVPELLDRARLRAQVEHLDARFEVGDAEALPVADGSFDVVTSVFGCMFAPNQQKAADELLRACRPGGTIALASWTPAGYIGEMFRIFGRFLPPAAGLQPPSRWGDPKHLGAMLGRGAASMTHTRRICLFKWRSVEENLEFFRTYYGPTLRAFERLDAARGAELAGAILDLSRRFNRNPPNGPVSMEGEYLETIIVRK